MSNLIKYPFVNMQGKETVVISYEEKDAFVPLKESTRTVLAGEEEFKGKRKEIGRIRAELEESRRSMEQEHRQMVSEMETQYVGVLCDLVKKLTGVLINDKKDVLLHLIRSSISDLKPSGHYTLRVSPEDLTLVENHLVGIRWFSGSGHSLVI